MPTTPSPSNVSEIVDMQLEEYSMKNLLATKSN